jgi:hypothetical protein
VAHASAGCKVARRTSTQGVADTAVLVIHFAAAILAIPFMTQGTTGTQYRAGAGLSVFREVFKAFAVCVITKFTWATFFFLAGYAYAFKT